MQDLLEQAETLQNLLVSRATGGAGENSEYRQLRQIFISNSELAQQLPRFVRTCLSLDQFWGFIKHKFPTYHERRQYIWSEFKPLFDILEQVSTIPSDETVSETLAELDESHVHSLWSKALDSRDTDPEGAITSARTLLETVCKYILDDYQIKYVDNLELPKLYRLTAESLNLAPSQHTEQVFRQILGGCTAVVEGLGSMRNKLSDAHGKGKQPVKPAARHAELAVNLAGALSTFLVSTWRARAEIDT